MVSEEATLAGRAEEGLNPPCGAAMHKPGKAPGFCIEIQMPRSKQSSRKEEPI